MTPGERLDALMRQVGYDQVALAAEIDVHVNTLRSWLYDEAGPPRYRRHRKRLHEVFGVDVWATPVDLRDPELDRARALRAKPIEQWTAVDFLEEGVRRLHAERGDRPLHDQSNVTAFEGRTLPTRSAPDQTPPAETRLTDPVDAESDDTGGTQPSGS